MLLVFCVGLLAAVSGTHARCSKNRFANRASNSSGPIACPPNSHYDQCVTACPLNCENYDNPPTVCNAGCGEGCKCDDGYVKGPDGNCIDPSQCPQCGPNSHYESCGTDCPLTCDNYKNPPQVCTARCNPSCQCDDGYVKAANGQCVQPKKCPKKAKQSSQVSRKQSCGANSYYTTCMPPCPKTCENYNSGPIACQNSGCVAGCQCYDGYVKTQDGSCVAPNQCQTCGPNAYYTTCGTNCPKTCDNYNSGPIACDASCRQGCQCYDGYVLNKNGQCVPTNQCQTTCGPNSHYDSCASACPKTCENYNRPNEACNAGCAAGCKCNDGYLLTKDGRCIDPSQCQYTCGVNEYYSNCKNPCNDCQRRGYCGGDGTYPCYYGCDCYRGYYRLNGKCVPQQQCPVN